LTALQRIGAELANLPPEDLRELIEIYAGARSAGQLERVRAHLPEFIPADEADALLELLGLLVTRTHLVDVVAATAPATQRGRCSPRRRCTPAATPTTRRT